jgi:hypothetical protein
MAESWISTPAMRGFKSLMSARIARKCSRVTLASSSVVMGVPSSNYFRQPGQDAHDQRGLQNAHTDDPADQFGSGFKPSPS